MPKGARGSAGIAVVILLLAIGLAVANVVVFAGAAQLTTLSMADIQAQAIARWQECPACVIYLGASPIILALLAVLLLGRRVVVAPAHVVDVPVEAGPRPEDSALRLLGLLQQEARFVDFVQENIDSYDDAQIGAAVRTIHADCRKALAGRIELERVMGQEEGSRVSVDKGFDPAAIRLSGNFSGEPPFEGTLQHPGWRATKVQLPEAPGGIDLSVIAPAEVEVG